MTTSPRPTSDAIGFVKEFDAAKARESERPEQQFPEPAILELAEYLCEESRKINLRRAPFTSSNSERRAMFIASAEAVFRACPVVSNAVNAHDDLVKALADYDAALARREHGDIAANACIQTIRTALTKTEAQS